MPFSCQNVLNTFPDSSEQGTNFILFHVDFLNRMFRKKETLVRLLGRVLPFMALILFQQILEWQKQLCVPLVASSKGLRVL